MSYFYFWIRISPNLTGNSVPSAHPFEVPVRVKIQILAILFSMFACLNPDFIGCISYLYFWIRIFPNLTGNSVLSWHPFEVPVRAEIRDFVVWKVSIVGNLLELPWGLCF